MPMTRTGAPNGRAQRSTRPTRTPRDLDWKTPTAAPVAIALRVLLFPVQGTARVDARHHRDILGTRPHGGTEPRRPPPALPCAGAP